MSPSLLSPAFNPNPPRDPDSADPGQETVAAIPALRTVGVDVSQLISEAMLMFVLCVTSLAILPKLLDASTPSSDVLVIGATWSLLYATAAVLCLRAAGGYVPHTLHLKGASDRCIAGVLLGTACVLAVVSFISRVPAIKPVAFVLAGTVNVIAIREWRKLSRRRVESAVRNGRGGRNVVIVGRGALARKLAAFLEQHQSLGYRMIGFVDDEAAASGDCLGAINDLPAICRSQFVDEILLTKAVSLEQARAIVERAREDHVDVTLVPDIRAYAASIGSLTTLGEYATMPIHRERRSIVRAAAKRSLDVVGALAGIIVASPLLLSIAVLIKLDSQGPVFYYSQRIGRKGRRFSFFKFRTMVYNAESLQDSVRHLNKRQGAFFKIDNDPRVTRLGRLLRKYSLDELPQLFNVLIGDMSLVGPRPHTLDDYKQYKPEHLRRLEVLPGITGLWQITARRDPSFDLGMSLDLQYIATWSIRNDLRILLRTIPVVLKGAGE